MTSCTSLGHAKDQDMHRRKLSGILHVVSIVEELCHKHNIIEGEITEKYDGLTAIKKSIGSETNYSYLANHFDLISEMHHVILKETLICSCYHITGHQNYQMGPLDRWSMLNVECNTEVNQKWTSDQDFGFISTRTHIIQDKMWRLLIEVLTNT